MALRSAIFFWVAVGGVRIYACILTIYASLQRCVGQAGICRSAVSGVLRYGLVLVFDFDMCVNLVIIVAVDIDAVDDLSFLQPYLFQHWVVV